MCTRRLLIEVSRRRWLQILDAMCLVSALDWSLIWEIRISEGEQGFSAFRSSERSETAGLNECLLSATGRSVCSRRIALLVGRRCNVRSQKKSGHCLSQILWTKSANGVIRHSSDTGSFMLKAASLPFSTDCGYAR